MAPLDACTGQISRPALTRVHMQSGFGLSESTVSCIPASMASRLSWAGALKFRKHGCPGSLSLPRSWGHPRFDPSESTSHQPTNTMGQGRDHGGAHCPGIQDAWLIKLRTYLHALGRRYKRTCWN